MAHNSGTYRTDHEDTYVLRQASPFPAQSGSKTQTVHVKSNKQSRSSPEVLAEVTVLLIGSLIQGMW